MATTTQPCPFCGAAVLSTAAHCGSCGRAMPTTAVRPKVPAPAKTIFGIQAPTIAPGPIPVAQPPAPTTPMARPPEMTQPTAPAQPGQPAPTAPPKPQAQAQPQPGSGGVPLPGQVPVVGQPPMSQPHAPNAPSPGQPGFGQPAYGNQPAPSGQPPAGQPQPQSGMPFGQAPYGEPMGDAPMDYDTEADVLGKFAAKLPASAPGTLFGFPLSRLQEESVRQKALFVAGIALLVGVFLPFAHVSFAGISKTLFSWSEPSPKFQFVVFPLVAAAAYLFMVKAPDHIRQKVPPTVLQWLPFGVAFVGVGLGGWGVAYLGAGSSLPGELGMLVWGYPILAFGLLNRLSHPHDSWARYIIGAGAVLCTPMLFSHVGDAFSFDGGFWLILHHLLFLVVLLLCVACLAFVPTPEQVPKLAKVDLFAPMVTAVLLGWLPLQALLACLALPLGGFATTLLMLIHLLIVTFAYFGILLLTAPEAYEEAKRMLIRSGHPPHDDDDWQGGQGPSENNP